ncbi:hypothetical protein NW066_01510 [Mycoplasmopsis felis]|uniref:hypothetical protein n=1 Tax=Mycoplasmopsis felis TaxID=33923 RepID=UPI0021AF3333|nr:hypothetical protein [Mycoplasmopsis felis]UWV85384.1 hypothetical protein NW066_01510 [Mycoplasmopsis felis]
MVLSNLLCKVLREPSGRLLIAFWASVCAWAYSASSTSCLWTCCILVRTSATYRFYVLRNHLNWVIVLLQIYKLL